MDLNVKATLEFARLVLPLDSLPLPAPGWEESGSGPRTDPWKKRAERVLEGEAEEIIIHMKKF
jgi:hypothetical protein